MNSEFTTILQECSIYRLSDLLFGDDEELISNFSYKNTEPIYGHIYIHILRYIKLRVSLWEINDFNDVGDINQATLDLLREEVIDKIDGFISYEKLSEYDASYDINPKESTSYEFYWYVQPGYGDELDIIQAFYEACTVFMGNSKLSGEELGDIMGGILDQARRGHRFSINTLRKMVSTLERFSQKDSTWRIPAKASLKYDFLGRMKLAQRQEIYEHAKKLITDYMKEYEIDRPQNWNEEYVKGYHIISLLRRNLGFDLLSFTTLNKDSFVNTISKNKFIRHHFRNNFFRTLSEYVQDLILTDGNHHRTYEQYSEAQMLVIINGFDKMMEMKGTGRDKDGSPLITKQDVIDIFKGDEWVLLGPDGEGGKDGDQGSFFTKRGFDRMLNDFNKRKSNLINNGLDQFIIDEYDTVYERFYLNFPNKSPGSSNIANADGFYSLVVPHPWLGDFAMVMNMDAWFLYPEY